MASVLSPQSRRYSPRSHRSPERVTAWRGGSGSASVGSSPGSSPVTAASAAPPPLGGIRGQSLGRVAVGHGVSSRREDVRELTRREAECAEVDVRRRLHRSERIAQQRLVPDRVLGDAVVGEP